MTTLLLPCDGSPHALLAVRHALQSCRQGDATMIHLLNVQRPFSAHIARHVDRALRDDFRRERADAALAEARRLLDAAGVAYAVHTEVGDPVHCIAQAARKLRCDRVVVGTARKNLIARAIGQSVTARLIEQCPVPVEVIGGAPASALERIGVPAGLGAGVALLWAGGA